ncbi:unnamed protein product [Lactuca virosa]|uniref:Uncharacterized protein n=1 Tax=Lactuca virosa TaxID=75947 RepID=A0AAU9MPR2_9ASTR|nr:unnamed protein product [Lactuca virosa]
MYPQLRVMQNTKEAPAIVKSYYDQRIVGCPSAEGEDEHDVVWFWLKKGETNECPVCSQYFKIVEPITAHYVFALGVARFLCCAHWILQNNTVSLNEVPLEADDVVQNVQKDVISKTDESFTPSTVDKSSVTSPMKISSDLKRNLHDIYDVDCGGDLSLTKSKRKSIGEGNPLLVPKVEKKLSQTLSNSPKNAKPNTTSTTYLCHLSPTVAVIYRLLLSECQVAKVFSSDPPSTATDIRSGVKSSIAEGHH